MGIGIPEMYFISQLTVSVETKFLRKKFYFRKAPNTAPRHGLRRAVEFCYKSYL